MGLVLLVVLIGLLSLVKAQANGQLAALTRTTSSHPADITPPPPTPVRGVDWRRQLQHASSTTDTCGFYLQSRELLCAIGGETCATVTPTVRPLFLGAATGFVGCCPPGQPQCAKIPTTCFDALNHASPDPRALTCSGKSSLCQTLSWVDSNALAFRCVEEGSKGVGYPVAVTTTPPGSIANGTDTSSVATTTSSRPSHSDSVPGTTFSLTSKSTGDLASNPASGPTSEPTSDPSGDSSYSTLTTSGRIGLGVGLGTSAVVIGFLACCFRRRRRRASDCQADEDTHREAEGSAISEDQASKGGQTRIAEKVINHLPRRASLI